MNLRRVRALAAPLILAAALVARCGSSSAHQVKVADHPSRPKSPPSAPHAKQQLLQCQKEGRIPSQGGPVQHHPRIYAVFWGAEWKSGAAKAKWKSDAAEKERLLAALRGLDGSAWSQTLTQYCDAGGHVGTDIKLAGHWTDASGSLHDQTISLDDEVNRAIAVNHWPTTRNTQVLLFLPDDWSASGACGHHDITSGRVAFAEIAGPGVVSDCGAPGDSDGGVVVSATHEVAAIATNPNAFGHRPAYLTFDGEELADACEDEPDAVGEGFQLTQLWSNWANRCVGDDPGLNL